jgi:hypothetical protein
MILRVISFVCLPLLLLPALGADVVVNSKLARGKTFRSVLVLPPQVDVAGKAPRIPRDSQSDLETAAATTMSCLQVKGYHLVESPAGPKNASESVLADIHSIQGKYDLLARSLLQSSADVAKGKLTMGAALVTLRQQTGADAFVFVRGRSYFPSGGLFGAALKMVTGPESVDVYESLVDGESGELLFFVDLSCPTEDFGKLLGKAFRKLPSAP